MADLTPVSGPDGQEGRSTFHDLARASRSRCEAGDHAGELRLWEDALSTGDDELSRFRLGIARALAHMIEVGASLSRDELASRLHAVVSEGITRERTRMDREGTRPATVRDNLDRWARYLLIAERVLGLAPSELTADLARREKDRTVMPRRSSTTRPPPPIEIWRRDGRDYWHDYYVRRHDHEPPDGWWLDRPELAMGGQVRPDLWREFGGDDPQASADFMDEMRRREQSENPQRERWASEAYLAACVAEALPGHEVIRQAPLGTQRLDVYVPSLRTAFEYQGEQHYYPLPHLGGDAGLENRRLLDATKRRACKRAGIRLVTWRYDREITVEAVRRRVCALGIIEDRSPA